MEQNCFQIDHEPTSTGVAKPVKFAMRLALAATDVRTIKAACTRADHTRRAFRGVLDILRRLLHLNVSQSLSLFASFETIAWLKEVDLLVCRSESICLSRDSDTFIEALPE